MPQQQRRRSDAQDADARRHPASSSSCCCVWVVVLGDFGRSPRMQYHAWSLADAGYDVRVLATKGAPPIAPVAGAPNVALHYLPPEPRWLAARLPALPALALKAAWQLAAMLWAVLFALPRPRAILMQNPPAIPVMLALWLAALRHRAALVIDWHNLAYSVLALKHGASGSGRRLVALARAYERVLGRRAHAHFCVTEAMRGFLEDEFGVRGAVVLYDRPPPAFAPVQDAPARGALLARLLPDLRAAALGADVLGGGGSGGSKAGRGAGASGDSKSGASTPAGARSPVAASSSPLTRAAQRRLQQQQQQVDDGGSGGSRSTANGGPAASAVAPPFTRLAPRAAGGVEHAPGRPALVVSSTSWTADEDFGILLAAARLYDAAAASAGGARGASLPDVLFVITGRGPQREAYLQQIAKLPLRRCAFASVWLEQDDYPKLLGAADLGVCLHTSSSGLDLPMKVVDMFGSGLPVCAARFDCIGELVDEGRTGLLFDGPEQLAAQLIDLLSGFGGRGGGGDGGGGDGSGDGGGDGGGARLEAMRAAVAAAHARWRWHDNWSRVAAPVIAAACGGGGGDYAVEGAGGEASAGDGSGSKKKRG